MGFMGFMRFRGSGVQGSWFRGSWFRGFRVLAVQGAIHESNELAKRRNHERRGT
jgi:hypothetical protein